jgi:hypothetical protein
MANNDLGAYSMNVPELIMHSYEAILAGAIAAVVSLLENILLCSRHHDVILPFTPQNATFIASWCRYHRTPLEKLVTSKDLHAVQWDGFWGSFVVLSRWVNAYYNQKIS